MLTVEVLSGVLTETVTLSYVISDGSAVVGDDYMRTLDTVTLSDTITRVTFRVAIVDDSVVESEEMFTVALGGAPVGVTLAPDVASVTINDDDSVVPVVIGFAPDMYSVDEDDGEVVLTVEVLSGVLTETVTLSYVISDGSAVVGDDYMRTLDTVTLSDTITRVTFRVAIVDDSVVESEEMFTVALGGAPVGVTLAPDVASVTINDDDPLPADPVVIGFEPVTYSVDENAGPVVLTVKLLSGTLTAPVTVNYVTMDGSAIAPGDYTAVSMGTLTLSPGDTEEMIMVTITDDNTNEPEEMFTVVLSGGSSGVILDPAIATVTIMDDDATLPPPPPEATHIEFVVLTATINEVDMYDIELRLVDNNGDPLTHSDNVVVTLEVFNAGRSLDLNEFMFSSTVTIPAGQITGVSRFISVDDTDVELDERVTLRISAVTMVSSSPLPGRDSRDMFTITVRDDDAEIGFSDTTYVVSEAAGVVTITIDIKGRLTEDVTLNYEIDPGTATETEDYVAPPTREIQLSAGATRATLFVQITNDNLYENADTFSVRLVEPLSGLPLGVELTTGMMETTVTITNDDEIEIGFVEGMYTWLENQGQGTVQVRYSGSKNGVEVKIAPGVTVTVSYSTTVVMGDSLNLMDLSGNLMISSMPTVYDIDIGIMDDNEFNFVNDEYEMSLSLLDMNDGLSLKPGREKAELNVLTDDVLDFGFSVTEYDVNEDAGTVELEVSVLKNTIAAGVSVVVRYSTTPGSATSAEPRRDFEPVMMGEVTLSSMSTVARFTIQITDDGILEDSESFVVTLTKADGRDTLQLLQSKATVTILDDNDPVTIGFGRASYSVTEGVGAVVNLDVGVLSGGLERDITATYEIRPGSAVAGEDYVDVTGTVVLSSDASEMISISLLDDDIFESDEIFTVVLTGHHGPSSVTLAPDSAIVTIKDDEDVPTISLDSVAAVTEGNSRDVIARLSGKLNKDVTVKLTAKDVSTEAGDYSFNPTITIPAGSLLATFTVVAVADPEYEGPEDVTLMVASDEVGPGTPIMRTLTINDNSRVTIGFQETTYRVDENGGNAVVRVAVLTGQIAPGVNIDVRYSTSFDSAMADSDYTTNTGMLRFNSKDIVHTIMIPITDDEIYEDAVERFTIDLTLVSSLARVSAAPAVSEILITDDDKPTLTIEIEGDTEIDGVEKLIEELEEGESVVVTVRLSNLAENPITVALTTLPTTISDAISATIGTVESGDYTITPDSVIPAMQLTTTFILTAIIDGRELDEILVLQASATGLESVTRTVTIPGTADVRIEPARPDRTLLICQDVDSGLQACVEVPTETVTLDPVFLEINKADAYQKVNIIAPADLPPAKALLDDTLIWDIFFVDDNGMVIETLSNTVRIELTASKALVDEYGGPDAVSIATLHSGSTDWVVLPTSYSSTVEMTPTGKEKYRFTAFSENFSLFTLIVPVTATLSPSAASVPEGRSMDLVITLTAPAAEDIMVTLSQIGGDAVLGTNYRLPSLPITIKAGERMIRVPITTLYDLNTRSEVIVLELSVQSTAAVAGLVNRATITIVDDPPPVATLELDPDGIQEGDSAVATYRLSHARAQVPITVSLRDIAGTSDLIISPASITLAPGETTAEFNLMAICDILPEGVETLTLEAISTELGSVRTMLDVRDIMLNVESVTELDEDDSTIVRVRLSSAGCNPTTVSLTAIGGTADADDYTLSQPSVTIDGADTIAEFRLTAHDDSQREPDETLVLEASVVGLESVTATITIIDFVEDDFGLLPPTGGLALPLWLVLTLLLTGLALVVGTVYVVRRRPSAPRV